MYKIIPLLLIALILSCSPRQENIDAKKKLINNHDINQYDPPVKSLGIQLSELKASNEKAIAKVLESPYRYLSEKLKAHKSKTYIKLTYSRVTKVEIPKYKPVIPKKDHGASDRKLPPKVNNFLSLSENIYIEHDKANNFMVKLDNSMGYKKDIRWINRILYINDDSDRYTTRKSVDNEHLKTLNEASLLFTKVLEMISYKITASYREDKTYNNRNVLVFNFKPLEKPYKKTNINKNSKIKEIKGSLYVDEETYAPIFIDLTIKWRFKSRIKNKKTNKPEFIDANFTIKRDTTNIGDNSIDIKTPEQDKLLNTKIPPSEADAEEKILNFKKGHSAIDKLKKEKEKREKLLGITKKKK